MNRTRLVLFGALTLVAVAVCIRLGIWQLDRLAQRRAQNAVVMARGAQSPVSVDAIRGVDTSVTHWRRVTIRGVADYAHEVVHATRSQAGSPGVHLLTPIVPIDSIAGAPWGDTAVLVIRGYVYAPDGRTIDYAKARDADTLQLDALVLAYPVPTAGRVTMPSNARAVRVLDRDTLAVMTGHPLSPMLLLALGDTTLVDITLPARVPPPAVTEGPHLSYALQWFGFATVFAVGFLAFARGARRRS